jgi:hypothetical protein
LGVAPERALIIGAGGWFGQTLLASHLLTKKSQTLLVGSKSGEIVVLNQKFDVHKWSYELVKAFQPNMVFNFAFLTREKVQMLGLDGFAAQNQKLTEQFLKTVTLPSVKCAMTVSSGVARLDYLANKTFNEEPYGYLKRIEEERFMQECEVPNTVVLRAFAVSGAFVSRPQDYAFSDLILQANRGSMAIKAREPVFRSYVSVEDSLKLVVSLWNIGYSGVVETGGDLVEMTKLAELIREIVNPRATINRPPLLDDKPSVYASSDGSWDAACLAVGLKTMNLRDQIQAVKESGFPRWFGYS